MQQKVLGRVATKKSGWSHYPAQKEAENTTPTLLSTLRYTGPPDSPRRILFARPRPDHMARTRNRALPTNTTARTTTRSAVHSLHCSARYKITRPLRLHHRSQSQSPRFIHIRQAQGDTSSKRRATEDHGGRRQQCRREEGPIVVLARGVRARAGAAGAEAAAAEQAAVRGHGRGAPRRRRRVVVRALPPPPPPVRPAELRAQLRLRHRAGGQRGPLLLRLPLRARRPRRAAGAVVDQRRPRPGS
jgi:hypothetical protein